MPRTVNRELWFHEIYGYCGLSFVLLCVEHCADFENAIDEINDSIRSIVLTTKIKRQRSLMMYKKRSWVGEMKLQIGLIVFGLIEKHIFHHPLSVNFDMETYQTHGFPNPNSFCHICAYNI